jgi:hypothetical protein
VKKLNALDYIDENLLRDEEDQLAAVKQNGSAIEYIDSSGEEVALAY